ncbi:hypothetical protein [Flavobacterium granuli]|uniref:Uncharacterized protein n=1 Tax=Flavobacterium granuli TaxID=280093 RepID=A0ABU1S3F4_9FLAO|nr:hypothetical protein [Flavobacterium granuli]MDR6845567.1 hypothetical protein [Flavobacterium granuli]
MKTENNTMMWTLFKKLKKEPIISVENSHSRFDIPMKFYLFVQDKWSKKMSDIASRLSKKKLVCSLGLFVILAGGICIYGISRSFINTAKDCIKIIPISEPMDAIGKSFVLNPKPFPISQKEFERIARFRMYLDSLGRSPIGKRAFDSIIGLRPGLMDSLVFIENYYKSNCKN